MKQHERFFDANDAECQAWIYAQLDAGNNDSGLATRFHYWLTDRLQLSLSFTETQTQFVALCQQLHVRCSPTDEGFAYMTEDMGNV